MILPIYSRTFEVEYLGLPLKFTFDLYSTLNVYYTEATGIDIYSDNNYYIRWVKFTYAKDSYQAVEFYDTYDMNDLIPRCERMIEYNAIQVAQQLQDIVVKHKAVAILADYKLKDLNDELLL